MTNLKLNDATIYNLFKTLEADPNLSQRALSRTLGISLGKVNYCLKARVTARFLRCKIAEYEKLQTEIEILRQEVTPESSSKH